MEFVCTSPHEADEAQGIRDLPLAVQQSHSPLTLVLEFYSAHRVKAIVSRTHFKDCAFMDCAIANATPNSRTDAALPRITQLCGQAFAIKIYIRA